MQATETQVCKKEKKKIFFAYSKYTNGQDIKKLILHYRKTALYTVMGTVLPFPLLKINVLLKNLYGTYFDPALVPISNKCNIFYYKSSIVEHTLWRWVSKSNTITFHGNINFYYTV